MKIITTKVVHSQTVSFPRSGISKVGYSENWISYPLNQTNYEVVSDVLIQHFNFAPQIIFYRFEKLRKCEKKHCLAVDHKNRLFVTRAWSSPPCIIKFALQRVIPLKTGLPLHTPFPSSLFTLIIQELMVAATRLP
ncbi:MAG TPA: hypothetical protein VK151_16265 [Fluviicola sp.]|nr:hypothetical protein [Fluviicola sp.]